MCLCLRACCTPSPKITSIIFSSTYCKNLLDEVVMGIKNYFFGSFSIQENLGSYDGATVVGATKPSQASGIPILGVKSGKEITRASAGLTTEAPCKSMKKST